MNGQRGASSGRRPLPVPARGGPGWFAIGPDVGLEPSQQADRHLRLLTSTGRCSPPVSPRRGQHQLQLAGVAAPGPQQTDWPASEPSDRRGAVRSGRGSGAAPATRSHS